MWTLQAGLPGNLRRKICAPELAAEVSNGGIDRVEVLRGAPCGATREAAARIVGWPVETAATRIGLEAQYFCSADPAGWDPLYGKSPVHFAREVHKAALLRALEKNGISAQGPLARNS